jgi:nitrogen fixation NifU-like protein
MSKELDLLYQETILDHYRRPRNFRHLGNANRSAAGVNPLCGDSVTIQLRIEDGRVQDIAFQGSGCAISQAAASMMTEALQKAPLSTVRGVLTAFEAMVNGAPEPDQNALLLGELAIFSSVARFPSRVKCVRLPWETLRAALHFAPGQITTEE